ncbi:hypothetical protein LTR86_006748 [Recurvomyces mirabilis]|nr:hypothetical protein LTR86_006748 [Recurvomyces mirabilis]
MESGSAILEKQVAGLREELKLWETDFAKSHGGRKASRDDISADASIHEKYREYNRLRRPIERPKKIESPQRVRKPQPGGRQGRNALRERSGNEVAATPSRRQKSVMILDIVEEDEEQEVEPTPTYIRCALGPTPQKDGQVLGIFDMAVSATPSKAGNSANALSDMPAISCTPSKSTTAPASSSHVPSVTPQSSSKRRMLDAFAGTPLKRQKLDEQHTPSTSKRHFATPSFLRRSFPLAPVEEEEGSSTTSGPLPQKKRGLVRSLSSIIRSLRQHEEERMDDEWDILDELEAEASGEKPAKVSVEDSQAGEMPLGPDQGDPLSDDSDTGDLGALGADGQPRKIWKKKGLKRQTKRSNMKPVLHKPQKAAEIAVEETVQETQLAGNEEDTDHEEDSSAARKSKKARDDTTSTSPSKKKKVSAQAHANFRRLKIKNKNSKANGRGGGKKFGRR